MFRWFLLNDKGEHVEWQKRERLFLLAKKKAHSPQFTVEKLHILHLLWRHTPEIIDGQKKVKVKSAYEPREAHQAGAYLRFL